MKTIGSVRSIHFMVYISKTCISGIAIFKTIILMSRGRESWVANTKAYPTELHGYQHKTADRRMIHCVSLLSRLFTLITLMKHLISPRVLQDDGVWPHSTRYVDEDFLKDFLRQRGWYPAIFLIIHINSWRIVLSHSHLGWLLRTARVVRRRLHAI